MGKHRLKILSLVSIFGAWSNNSQAADFGFSFKWCGDSPSFSLHDVPKQASKLEFNMLDLDYQGYPHGGATVDYKGQKTIPCGSFTSMNSTYDGPHPPSGEHHHYVWTIKALGSDGATVAKATAQRIFPE